MERFTLLTKVSQPRHYTTILTNNDKGKEVNSETNYFYIK